MMSNNPIQKVGIIMAMEIEAAPVIAKLGLKLWEEQAEQLAPLIPYRGELNGGEILLLINGKCTTHQVDRIGTQPAAIATWEMIRLFQPDLIITAGTAGGFAGDDTVIGDVFVSTGSINYHDRRVPLPGGFVDYGRGIYSCVNAPRLAEALQLKQGNVSTGNALDMTAEDLRQMRANKAHVKEMEAAAVAEVAQLKQVPVMAIKAVTDLVDKEEVTAAEQFLINLEMATEKLTEKLAGAVGFIMGKRIDEL